MEKQKKLPRALLNRYKLIRRTKSEKTVFTVAFILFFLYSLLILTPIAYLFIIGGFASSHAYSTFQLYRTLPDYSIFNIELSPNFENFTYLFKQTITSGGKKSGFWQMLFNSVWFCLAYSVGGAVISSFTGYVISKYKFPGRDLIYAIVIFCMTIPIIGTTGAAIKLVGKGGLGIKDTPLYVIFTCLGGFGFNFMILHAFFKNVSWNYAEAVFIDGGGHFTAFFKVMLPQAHSSITTLIILSLIGTYNDYSTPLLFLRPYPTIASGIYQLTVELTKTNSKPGEFAALLVSILPVVLLFAIFSDKVMKNFSIGGLKG